MAISPISSQPIAPVRGVGSATPTEGAAQPGLVGQFGQMLESVAASSAEAAELGTQIATGEITDIHQFAASAAKAELGTQMTVAFRDRAVEAFQTIMAMQV
ncbi:MAG: flagellar hook-basal body complex protein FliE [Acidimicrobiales bacterium]